jgi:predicted nucleic acid-binding protein
MNGSNLLVDTNIIVYLLNGDTTLSAFLQGRTVYISFVTQLELLSYASITEEEEKRINDFLEDCIVIDINQSIKKEVIDLKRKYKVKLPDSIIMASALYLGLPILTSDNDFNNIEKLEVIFYK